VVISQAALGNPSFTFRGAVLRICDDSRIQFADSGGSGRHFVFAIEGALMAVENELDLLGIMRLMRDVLLGAVPPKALRDSRYSIVAFAGGVTAFVGSGFAQHVPRSVLIDLDAAGLALFAVAGTEKALQLGMPSLIAVCLGAVTGVGGGTVRDVLLTHVAGWDVLLWAASSECLAGVELAEGDRLPVVMGRAWECRTHGRRDGTWPHADASRVHAMVGWVVTQDDPVYPDKAGGAVGDVCNNALRAGRRYAG
jgi:hypothetical protein